MTKQIAPTGSYPEPPSTVIPRAHHHTKPPPPVKNIYLTFRGVGFTSGVQRSFDVTCGAKPPTITDGYAKWTTLPRPLQRSLTIFAGYDPAEMTVDVIFGQWGSQGWQTDDTTGSQVETDIGHLEWFGGSNFQAGPSPAVYVASYSSKGGQTDLVPPQYRALPWIVTALAWGTAYRNPNGYRVWQEATITLRNYLNLNAAPPQDANASGGYFTSRPSRDTPLLIAGSPSTNSPIVDHSVLAGRICEDPSNNPCHGTTIRLARKGVYYRIRHGVKVWIPSHQSG